MRRPGEPDQWPADVYVGEPKPFCDVVMKGGVTSGVVYPFTICHIASEYVIRSIGGTSVGAIAAALTAAAEFRRRSSDHPGEGYKRFAGLPKFLGTKGNLRALFAADANTASFLEAALTVIAVDDTGKPLPRWKKTLNALSIMLRPSVGWLAAATVLSVVLDPLTWILVYRSSEFPWWIDWLFALFELGVTLSVLALVALFRLQLWIQACVTDTGENNFGWAHGHGKRAPNGILPLIDWLHEEIQITSGLDGTRPLTFGDLLSCGLPKGQTASPNDTALGVNLRMNTTCLTLNRPFTLPFDPANKMTFYFKIDDFKTFFADDVVAYLDEHCDTHVLSPEYRVFPHEEILPVVVAARMSMSFPVLFSAVRLYAEDPEGTMQPMWFSDGGLTSNMPIHYFDGPLPRWPTFAIDLLGSDPDPATKNRHATSQNAGDVFIEGDVDEGAIEPWDRLGVSMVDYCGAIIETARTWQDRLLGHTAGYSERTVGIRLHADEGGLNIDMPQAMIHALTSRGDDAGVTLMAAFKQPGTGWPAHRWTRFRNTMKMLSVWLVEFRRAYNWTDPVTRSDYGSTAAQTMNPVPPSKAQPWQSVPDAEQAACLSQSAAELQTPSWSDLFENGVPEPTARLVARRKF